MNSLHQSPHGRASPSLPDPPWCVPGTLSTSAALAELKSCSAIRASTCSAGTGSNEVADWTGAGAARAAKHSMACATESVHCCHANRNGSRHQGGACRQAAPSGERRAAIAAQGTTSAAVAQSQAPLAKLRPAGKASLVPCSLRCCDEVLTAPTLRSQWRRCPAHQ